MRGGRSLLILLVLALGLGGYIYFVESKRDLTDAETKKAKVFSIETGKIDELQVTSASGEVTALKKSGDTWQIVKPVAATADSGAVSSLVSTIETLEQQRSLDDAPSNVAQFGLDPVRFSVAYKIPGDANWHTLNLGNKTPTGSDLYARVDGQPKLFLVSAYIEDSINRSTFDLRDKTVLAFDRDKVDAVTLQAASGPALTLTKKGPDWRMSTPIDAKADFSPVDGMIGRVSQVQMKSLINGDGVEPTPAQLKTYGLDTPQLTVTLVAGSAKSTLVIGGKKDDTSLYARDVSRPLVFTVENALLSDLQKKPDDLRVRDVFEFKPFSATAIDITHGAVTASFEKSKSGTDANASEVWKQTKPTAKDANLTAMTDLLNTLSALRADSFTEKPFASGDDLVVAAKTGEGTTATTESVTLRKSGTVVHAIRSGERGAAVVPTADFDKALTQLKALLDAK